MSEVDVGNGYLPGPLLKEAGLGAGLVRGKTLDVFVLLGTSKLLAAKGLSPPLTLVQVGEEAFPGAEHLGNGELPVGEFVTVLEELMLVGRYEDHILVVDPLMSPKADSTLWRNYLRGEGEHPWVKKRPSFKTMLSSNLLSSPRLSTTGGSSGPVSRGDGLYTIEKRSDGERTEWKITPAVDSYSSGELLAMKMNLGLPKDSEERSRFVRGIACLAVYASRTVPFPEEAFRDPGALSEAIVSEFRKVYGLVAEKLLEGAEEEVEKAIEDLVIKTYPQESSPVSEGPSETPL